MPTGSCFFRHTDYSESRFVSAQISAQEMATLLPVLIQGVNDTDPSACLGVCRALQGMLLNRANETRLYVEKLMEVNVDELRKRLTDRRAKEDNPVVVSQLQSVCVLTREHFEPVLEWLLKQKIPVSKFVIWLLSLCTQLCSCAERFCWCSSRWPLTMF